MKTKAEWYELNIPFSEYAEAGDEVDSEIYYHFLGVVPPLMFIKNGFMVGEPFSTTANGYTYMTFRYSECANRYWYSGIMTANDALSLIAEFDVN